MVALAGMDDMVVPAVFVAPDMLDCFNVPTAEEAALQFARRRDWPDGIWRIGVAWMNGLDAILVCTSDGPARSCSVDIRGESVLVLVHGGVPRVLLPSELTPAGLAAVEALGLGVRLVLRPEYFLVGVPGVAVAGTGHGRDPAGVVTADEEAELESGGFVSADWVELAVLVSAAAVLSVVWWLVFSK